MTVEDILTRLNKVTPEGEGHWMACCPAHADRTPSLSVGRGDNGRVLLRCFAGCPNESIVAAMGLKFADLMGDEKAPFSGPHPHRSGAPADPQKSNEGKLTKKGEPRKPRGKIVARYAYQNAEGATVFEVCRMDPKSFCQRVPDPEGKLANSKDGWAWGRSRYGVGEVIYRLPKVLAHAASGKVIFVVEGEKDVETLERLGCVATCNPGGAGKWRDEFAGAFKGARRVVIIADNDAGPESGEREYWQGQKHACAVADSMAAAGVAWQAMVMPDRAGKQCKDVSDWVGAGGTQEELRRAVADAPAWDPEPFRAALEKAAAAPSLPLSPLAGGFAGGVPPLPRIEKNAAGVGVGGNSDGGADQGGGAESGKTELMGAIWDALKARAVEKECSIAELTTFERREIVSDAVLAWLLGKGRFFYHATYKDHGSLMYFNATSKALLRIDSDEFRSWIAIEGGLNTSTGDYKYMYADILDAALKGKATRGIVPDVLWARRDKVIYLSCGDGQVCRVAGDGCRMVDNGTDDVVFLSGRTLAPWQLTGNPVDPFEVCALFRDMTLSTANGKDIIRLWVLSMPYNHDSKTPLLLTGGPGSGKTRAARGIFELFGISPRLIAVDGKDGEESFWVSVDSGGLVCLDNVDSRIKWFPDTLANYATLGSREVRKKYSDSDVIVQRARSAVVITSATPQFASDFAVADRIMTVRMERREDRATADRELGTEIAAIRNDAMTWVARSLATALADTQPVPTGINFRHPDFAAFAVRLGRAIGQEAQTLEALGTAENDKSVMQIENDDFGAMLFKLMRQVQAFAGHSADMRDAMLENVDGFDDSFWTLPKIGRRIERLWPAIRKVFDARTTESGHKKRYVLEVKINTVGVNVDLSKTLNINNTVLEVLEKEAITPTIDKGSPDIEDDRELTLEDL